MLSEINGNVQVVHRIFAINYYWLPLENIEETLASDARFTGNSTELVKLFAQKYADIHTHERVAQLLRALDNDEKLTNMFI